MAAIVARNDAARAALARAPAPTRAQLLQLLRSGPDCSDCALAFAVSRRVTDAEVAAAVLGRYRPDDPYPLRADTFTYLSFVLATPGRLEHAHLVRRILCSETDPSLLAIMAVRIDEFAPSDAAEMYACYLQRGPTIRRIAYGLLEGAGKQVREDVRKRLAQEGAHDALRFLSEAEAAER